MCRLQLSAVTLPQKDCKAQHCVLDCIQLVDGLKDAFSVFRDNSQCDFEKVLKLTDELMIKHEIKNLDVTISRQRKLPARLSDSVVVSNFGRNYVRNVDDRQRLWNEILD